MARVTAAERIATLIGYDLAEMSEYRYQSSRYKVAVYAIGNGYYCAPATNALPDVGYHWKELGEFKGGKVYVAEVTPDNLKDA